MAIQVVLVYVEAASGFPAVHEALFTAAVTNFISLSPKLQEIRKEDTDTSCSEVVKLLFQRVLDG